MSTGTDSKFTYQVFCKGAGIETIACTHLGCFLLPQVCGHNQEPSIQSRFSHLSNCRETLKAAWRLHDVKDVVFWYFRGV